MNAKTDEYFSRTDKWRDEMAALRPVLLDCGLAEDFKWGKPCYTSGGKNIAIMQGMKDFLALMFFKGALVQDPAGILERQGPNSKAGFRARFTSTEDIRRKEQALRACVADAIRIEEAGLSVPKADAAPALVEELQQRLAADPALKAAFDALTPGRQRGYNLFIAGARQPSTRISRIDKHRHRILDGKGLHD